MLGRLALIACLALVACKKERAKQAPPAPEPPAPVVDDSLFVVAKPRVVSMGLPAQFTGPLPATLRDLERGLYPRPPFIRMALAANTYDMRNRMVAALKRAAEAGTLNEDVANWYENLVGYGPDVATCKWIVETASAGKLAKPANDVLWRAMRYCRYPELAPAFAREDVPDDVIVDWYFEAFLGDELHTPFNERVARAAAAYARTSDNNFKVRQIGFVFARMTGDESIAAITALQKSLPDAERRAWVGVGMLRSASPAGKAIGQRACKHPKVKDDPMCKPDTYATTPRPTDLKGMLEYGEDIKTVLAKHPKPAVVAALGDCVTKGKDYRRVRCFAQLAGLDRAAALGIAAQASADEPRIGAIARSLEKFPDLAAAEKELTRLGFKLDKPKPKDEAMDSPVLTIEDVLFARGRTHWFDAETGQFPNEHDELLAELAALAAPVLDGVVFEEIPPTEADDDRGGGTYALHAYLGGKRYSVNAENHGDWYDVAAVIGLVNALLVAKQSDVRLAVLPTGDQTVKVLVGPAKGTHALVDAKLIEIGQTDEAERDGKAFEDRAFEAIRGDAGGEVLRDVRIPSK